MLKGRWIGSSPEGRGVSGWWGSGVNLGARLYDMYVHVSFGRFEAGGLWGHIRFFGRLAQILLFFLTYSFYLTVLWSLFFILFSYFWGDFLGLQ